MTPAESPEHPHGTPPEYRILNSIEDAVVVVDEDGGIVWGNPAFRRIAGSLATVRALGFRPGPKDPVSEFGCRLRDRSGEEKRYRCSGSRTPSGRGWVLLFREAEDDWRGIVEYTGTATVLVEGDGTISMANAGFERLTGYPRGEVVGTKRLADLAADGDRERIVGCFTGAAPGTCSFTLVDRSGIPHVVEATVGPIPGTARSVISLLDVTGRNRAERALRESEERLNLALAAAEDGLVDWDLRSGSVFYSRRSFTMLGYEPGAFTPTIPAILSLVHPEDRDDVGAAFAGMAAGVRDRCEMEFRMRSASGEWVYVLDRLRVVERDARGMPLRIAGTHTEITERKRAERELLIGRMSLESSFAAIAIADLDGYITHVNPSLLALGGLTDPGEVLGRHLTEFWVEPAKVERGLATFAERGRCTGKLIGKKADGTEFTAHVTATILRDDSGNPICIMATAVDITEEIRMAQALRESEERYRTLAESAPDIIFLVGVEGNVLYMNGAGGRLIGAEPETLQGKKITEIFPPEIAKKWLTTIRRIAQTGRPFTGETLLPGEGSGTWLEARLIPMKRSDGTVRSLLGISRDITGRKQTEEQLRFQARVLSQVEDAVTATDNRERITYMNRAAEQFYGVPSGEALGRPASELLTHGWLRPGDEEGVRDSLRSSGMWHGAVLQRKRDGDVICVDLTVSTLNDEDGKSTGTLWSLRDVTGQKRAEQELRIKDMAIASALEGISLTGLDRRIIYVNRAFFAMHGYEREDEIVGQPVSALWADPVEMNWIQEEFIRNGTWSGEVKGRRKDGSAFPMQLALSVVTDEAGRRICTMGSGIDITERKRAEQELRIRDMAIASSPSAFTVADLDGRLTYVNQAFLSTWGYDSPTEVIGRRVTELWQNEEEARKAFQKVVHTGSHTGERIGKRRDGTTFYAMFSGNLVRGSDGVPICVTASLNDITGQKRAEAEVQAHNRALSVLNRIVAASASAMDLEEALESVLAVTLNLLDLSGGGIYLIEPGRQSARLVCIQGLPERFSAHPCIPDSTVEPYATVLVAGEPVFIDDYPELRYPGEGDDMPHPCASIPITAHGRVIGALNVVEKSGNRFTDADRSLLTAIGREIGTSVERAMLIRQLELAEREANLYLDILSHDIRNAENVSGLYTDFLIDMLEGEAKGYAQKLQASIRKSVEILRNVSTIRRIHKESAVLVPIDLDGVIREEIGIFSGSRIHYGGTNLTVMADALLPEVFTNLIGNAVKFGGPTAEVAIRVDEQNDEVLISVEDTGPGIPGEMKEAVFMRFGQSRSRKSGQGLGLYITRMLVERYGGRVRVDDRVPGRPGCGAAFRFTLKKA